MPATKIVLPLLIAGAIGAAYAAGRYVGRYDGDREAAASVALTRQSNAIEMFFVAQQVIDGIQAAKLDDATRTLASFATLQGAEIAACRKSPRCMAMSGQMLPSTEQMQRMAAISAFRAASAAN